jgi:hypothetical protein
MNIVVLTFEGCPNAKPAFRLIQQTLEDLGLNSDVKQISVRDEEEAGKLHFLGSPTVQIDGRDIEIDRRSDTASFSCRIYNTSSGNSGVPPKQMIVDAILEAQHDFA